MIQNPSFVGSYLLRTQKPVTGKPSSTTEGT